MANDPAAAINTAKAWLNAQVPPGAQKLVVAYALQLAIANEIKAQAMKAGASESAMKYAEAFSPMIASSLLG